MGKSLNLLKRIITFFIGMTIIQFGVALYVKTNIGSDPFTVFTQGLSMLLNISIGQANMIILATLITIIFLVGRKHINIGTLICVVGVGPIIDLGVKLSSYFAIESLGLISKMLVVVLGCVIIAIGFSILSASNLGVAPNDIIPFLIQEKTNYQYRWIRISLDATLFVVGGILLNGVYGIGTVISLLLTGPFIQICLPYGEKFIKLITKEETYVEEESVLEN